MQEVGRFLEYKQGRSEIKNIVEIIKSNYPGWRKNKYYKSQSMLFKINCNIFYSNNMIVIMLFQKLKKCIKRGKK